MLKIHEQAMTLQNGRLVPGASDEGRKKTMAYRILAAHNLSDNMVHLKLRFDAMASHDITYVGIIQTARASGLERFPLPYVLTNCHNSLCAVGGTINEDDHVFGLSAAKRYGGEFVPAHQSVIHSYMRECYAGGGRMILGSDSHTRYGAYGTLGIGEGGPELVKQLLCKTYDIDYPRVVGVHLTGKPRAGVGPQDVALAIIGATFRKGTVKNSIMEFFGDGVQNLSMDYRNGIDVMTTETSCLSSVWQTDGIVKETLQAHGRGDAFVALAPSEGASYDAAIEIDLSKVECMIALPFHPSNVYTIREFNENAEEILSKIDPVLTKKVRNGRVYADQGVIAGCSGGMYQNLVRAAEILGGEPIGDGAFSLSCYPASQPVMLELLRTGELASLMASGASVRSAFCGPCFGAGDVPANGGLSIRHTTRNFPNREGSKPSDGQVAFVALMDARSIAASARNGGIITAATDLELPEETAHSDYQFNASPYSRVYHGVGNPKPEEPLVFGPNITDWPEQIALPKHLRITVASAIYDPVTTTDELIPSGETSSYRSNPLRLSEFALSRKDPAYVSRAKAVLEKEKERRRSGADPDTGYGTAVMALRPGDGSAREQAASCQRVLGGVANFCEEYATKRYRSNVINWGMLPFTVENIEQYHIQPGDTVFVENIRQAVESGKDSVVGILTQDGKETELPLKLENLTAEEREILLAGCLINYYA